MCCKPTANTNKKISSIILNSRIEAPFNPCAIMCLCVCCVCDNLYICIVSFNDHMEKGRRRSQTLVFFFARCCVALCWAVLCCVVLYLRMIPILLPFCPPFYLLSLPPLLCLLLLRKLTPSSL